MSDSHFTGDMGMNSLKVYSVVGYVLMVAALVPLIYLKGLFSDSLAVIVIQILSVCLMVWARTTFGSRSFHLAANPTEGGLVTSGPYRYIRHPIYASIVYFTTAGVVANLNLVNGVLLGLLCSGVAVRVYCEEKLIMTKYPDYADYAGRTRRIIPFVF
jgi:protein-S-isoprenylcysteine O-methyltransferase Ste14